MTTREQRLIEALRPFVQMEHSIATDLHTAHNRGDAASDWMREDDGDLRDNWRKACSRARDILASLLPDPMETTFKPGLILHPELGLIEYVHEDTAYFARPAYFSDGTPKEHFIDAHIAMDGERLVGFNIWFLPNWLTSSPPKPEEDELRIVFDGPPGHESGRFVEVETPDGRSINAGEWHKRQDGYWELRISTRFGADRITALQAELASVRERTIQECVALVNKMISDWRSNKDVQSVLASAAFGIRALSKSAEKEKGE